MTLNAYKKITKIILHHDSCLMINFLLKRNTQLTVGRVDWFLQFCLQWW